MNRGPKDS
uniref:Uncharacterized protein n=1 Tax=Anguilla anguilla TaxID=7936 RepID=A0A0E9QBB3_ANGAN